MSLEWEWEGIIPIAGLISAILWLAKYHLARFLYGRFERSSPPLRNIPSSNTGFFLGGFRHVGASRGYLGILVKICDTVW